MRSPVLLLALAWGCVERAPPPGAGALETTPTASGSARREVARSAGARQIAAYPGGGVLLADAGACRLTSIEKGKPRWTRDVPACDGLLEAAIGADSVAYVRARKALFAFEPDGKQRWRANLDEATPTPLCAPMTLADSRVALATSPRVVSVYAYDGRVAWQFSTPADEPLVSPPVAFKGEGLVLLTARAAYALGSDGELHWRTSTALRP
jgi:outer membrane protein assembly factor BamB